MYQIINHYRENSYLTSDFRLKSRVLWTDHVSYTRNAITSIIATLSDVGAVSARLIKNQEDIGTFISPYYSTQEVFTLVDLLKTHITIAVDVVNEVEGAEANWRMNGNDIVMQMSHMNKLFWPVSSISPMWTTHLDLTIEQIKARKKSEWDIDIAAYDRNHSHMLKFSDVFSDGIVYQNMDKFCIM